MTINTEEIKQQNILQPKFLDPSELTEEQLTDPDYALKQLEKLAGGKLNVTCSKCHHCR